LDQEVEDSSGRDAEFARAEKSEVASLNRRPMETFS